MPSWLRLLKNSEKQDEPHIIIINTYQYQHQHHYQRHHHQHQHHHHYHRHHRHHRHHHHHHQNYHVRLSSWGTRCQSFFSVLCLAHVWVFSKHSAKHFRDTKHHAANNCCNIPTFRQLSHNFQTTIWIIGWARISESLWLGHWSFGHLWLRSFQLGVFLRSVRTLWSNLVFPRSPEVLNIHNPEISSWDKPDDLKINGFLFPSTNP